MDEGGLDLRQHGMPDLSTGLDFVLFYRCF